MGIFGRLNRHAIARNHIKMGRARKRIYRCLNRIKGRLHQRPFAPAAFDPLFRKRNVRIIRQTRADFLKRLKWSTRIKMNCDKITNSRQLLCLLDNCVRVLVTQENESDLCHTRIRLPETLVLLTSHNVNRR